MAERAERFVWALVSRRERLLLRVDGLERVELKVPF